MRKFTFVKRQEALSIVAMTAVAANMLFLPPYLPMEEYKVQKIETVAYMEEESKKLARRFVYKRKKNRNLDSGYSRNRLK